MVHQRLGGDTAAEAAGATAEEALAKVEKLVIPMPVSDVLLNAKDLEHHKPVRSSVASAAAWLRSIHESVPETQKVRNRFRIGSPEVPEKMKTHRHPEPIPNRFRTDSEPIPNRFSNITGFRTDSEPIPNRFRTDSEPIPKNRPQKKPFSLVVTAVS